MTWGLFFDIWAWFGTIVLLVAATLGLLFGFAAFITHMEHRP